MVNTKGESIGLWWVGGHRYENVVLENNLFYVAQSQNVKARALSSATTTSTAARRLTGPQPRDDPLSGSPFASMTPMDFRLRPDSAAVDAGAAGKDKEYRHQSRGKAPDLGAIELGDAGSSPSRPALGPRQRDRQSPQVPERETRSLETDIPRLDHPVRVDGSLDEWGRPRWS